MADRAHAQSIESATAIIARLSSHLDRLEERNNLQKRTPEEIASQGQTRVLLKLMRRDLDDLQQALERDKQDAARLNQLTQVTKLLTSSLDLEQVVTEVIDAVITFLEAQRAFLILADDVEPNFEVRIARNWVRETLSKEEVSFSQSIVEHVSRTHEAVITHTLQHESWLHRTESPALLNVRMVVCLPLLRRDHLIGVIYADSTNGQGTIGFDTAATRSVLMTFADQVAIALENARVFGQIRSHLHDAQRQLQRQLLRESDFVQNPSDMFHMMLSAVSQLLEVSYAELAVAQGDAYKTVVVFGEPCHPTTTFPLVFQQEIVGRLVLPPLGERAWMVNHLSQQIAVIVYAIRLSMELQHSREKMAIAREEERRRVRDELHDVIGSRLAIMPILLDLVATASADEGGHLLELLKAQIQNVMHEIQRFIRQLRPITLDQIGLYGAIEQVIHELSTMGQLKVVFSAPPHLPPLSKAVEIAAFRIASEALANVVRHALATHCLISVKIEADQLWIEVSDNGQGIQPNGAVGVGLNSMRERAVELGGSFSLQSGPGSGTTVVARLPLHLEEVSL